MNGPVLIEVSDGVLEITINRPEAKNAINLAVAESVAAALDELDGRPDLAVGIITGAGGTFSAGMDLKAFLRGERPTVPGRGFAGIAETPPAKPIIAAVEGYALAGGCEIVLACDLVTAGRGARFGIPEVKRGLVVDDHLQTVREIKGCRGGDSLLGNGRDGRLNNGCGGGVNNRSGNVDHRRSGRRFCVPALRAGLLAVEPLADAALRSLCQHEKSQAGDPRGRGPGKLAGGFDGALDVR